MNDWQKVAYHVFGVNLTQKNWALTALKNITASLYRKVFLTVLVLAIVAYLFGLEAAHGLIILGIVFYMFYSINKTFGD